MDAIQVNAVLLRGLLPDLRLTPGATLAGRVMERHGAHGLLNLAGAVLVAELPADVPEGARLRLAVQDVGAERIVLRIVGDAAAPAPPSAPPPPAQPAPVVALPLPGGMEAHARVEADGSGAGGAEGEAAEGTRAVTVRYASPTLGSFEVRLVLTPAGLSAGVTAPPGEGLALAGAHAEELRAALSGVLGTTVDVHVGQRRDRVDLRA